MSKLTTNNGDPTAPDDSHGRQQATVSGTQMSIAVMLLATIAILMVVQVTAHLWWPQRKSELPNVQAAQAKVPTVESPPAASVSAACQSLGSEISSLLKDAAIERMHQSGDMSTLRATTSELKVSNAMSIVNTNLALMLAQHCPLPIKKLSPSLYINNTFECSFAEYRKSIGEKADSLACDTSKWKTINVLPST